MKLLILGVVSIVILIVLSSIKGLVRERKGRLAEVKQDIAGSYAGQQRILGPIFTLSVKELWTERLYNKEKDTWYDKEMSRTEPVLFYPETLSYDGRLLVQERYRGIFKANVFQSTGQLRGSVVFPEVGELATKKESRVELVAATACVLMSDLRGITHVPAFNWGGQTLEVSSGSNLDRVSQGVHAKLPEPGELPGNSFDFSMDLSIHGMGVFEVVPIGAQNKIMLSSEWPHPSFIGDFLATDRAISPEGFSAEWNVNGLACSARQQLSSGHEGSVQRLGVELIDPVNVYPLTDRALKYGFLFVFITFSAFFLFEIMAVLRIHPIQYGFVGLAQAIFFLLLLSLSEHIGFGVSYFSASAATVGLITFYLCFVLKSVGRGVAFGGLLLLLYSVLYALLQSEDHALVAGSALVFGLLALAMLLTRKVDWYTIGIKREEPEI